MAKLGNNNYTEPQEEAVTIETTPHESVAPHAAETAESEDAPNPQDTTDKCEINDTNTPILVLFGPSQCGKSMTMVRLVRYLQCKGYTVTPRRDFRPSDDHVYEERCDEFNNTIATYKPLPGTDWQDYMLATVFDDRGSVLQILEAPGEAYFSLKDKFPLKKPYPAYLNKIKSSSVPKIWCFFIEPDWKAGKHAAYITRIQNARTFINLRKDKIIFLYNKVDMVPQYINFGKINTKGIMQFANQQYPGLFNAFKNTRMVEKSWKPYLCEFVPFSTGDYSGQSFTESNDMYPAMLLKKIL